MAPQSSDADGFQAEACARLEPSIADYIAGGAEDEITLLEIFEAIDGQLPNETCLLGRHSCTFGNCIFGTLLPTIHGMVSDHFSGTTLADLIVASGETASAAG